jgi:hypothetical protein
MVQGKKRWQVAQEQEKNWWKRGIASIDFGYLSRFASELQDTAGGGSAGLPARQGFLK